MIGTRAPGTFENRADAGRCLAACLREVPLRRPLVLAIPRGGIDVALPIAQTLGADLDVVLSRKIGAPWEPELALGAIAESGGICLNESAERLEGAARDFIDQDAVRQLDEIARRARLYRGGLPRASVKGRSVIVTDDGIATGATMHAALRTLLEEGAHEVIVAVPVAPPDRLDALRPLCDKIVCLHSPEDFRAVGQFYRDFDQVTDEHVAAMLSNRPRP